MTRVVEHTDVFPRLRIVGLLVVLVVSVVVVSAAWHWLLVHLSQEMGLSNEASRSYAFWSGFAGDVSGVGVWTLLLGAWRHHSCHTKGCLRLGHPVAGGHFRTCYRHDPKHPRARRSVPHHVIVAAHHEQERAA